MKSSDAERLRIWIETPDVETAQGFPLDILVRAVSETLTCRSFTVHRSSGYGRDVIRLGDACEREGATTVGVEDLLQLATGTEQWFYDIEVSCDGPDGRAVTFGLHDSSSLFVEGNEGLARTIVEYFESMRTIGHQGT